MNLPTVAISIMQPWAWLIVNGHKDIENRDWRTKRRGPVLIHTGLKRDTWAHEALLEGRCPASGEPISDELRLAYTRADGAQPVSKVQRGGIVGVATITGCVDDSDSRWFVGRYGFTLADARPLPFMPMKGKLSFFDATYDPPPEPGN